MHTALTIAGSDSGGGAGIQADLKTFEALEVFGTSVITALTAQNTVAVTRVMAVPDEMVVAQLEAVLSDFQVGAAKTGMLFQPSTLVCVADFLRGKGLPLVCDPVMVATSGARLLQPEAISVLASELLPLATVITPNREEAAILAGMPVDTEADMLAAAAVLGARWPQAWILLKGGHMEDVQSGMARDLLWHAAHAPEWVSAPRIATSHTHGTGCTLSAAITAGLAQGLPVPEAVRRAKSFVTEAIRHAWATLGQGKGCLRHNHYRLHV